MKNPEVSANIYLADISESHNQHRFSIRHLATNKPPQIHWLNSVTTQQIRKIKHRWHGFGW